MRRTSTLFTLALLICPACVLEDDVDDDDAIDLRVIDATGISGGTVFNTPYLESALISELNQPMGEEHHHSWLAEMHLNDDTAVDHFLIVDGEIVAVDPLGFAHSGAALVDSIWRLMSPGKSPGRLLKIAALTYVGKIPYYHFQNKLWDDWTENCPPQTVDNVKGPGLARMLGGFSLDQSTGRIARKDGLSFIACTTGAVGKAVAWGYYDFGLAIIEASGLTPPVESTDPISPQKLGPMLEADTVHAKGAVSVADAFKPLELAIRVVRADYCYDGKSHTESGVRLLVEDVWGIRKPDAGTIEAVWGADGLICAGKGRRDFVFQDGCPKRLTPIPTCDPDAKLGHYTDGLIMTRLPGPGLDEDDT